MALVTITITPTDSLLLVGLHRPGPDLPDIFPGAAQSVTLELGDGLYRLTVAATGLQIDTVTATISAGNTLEQTVTVQDGTVTEGFDFVVSGDDIL